VCRLCECMSQFTALIGGWRFAGKLTHMVTDASVCNAQEDNNDFCVFLHMFGYVAN